MEKIVSKKSNKQEADKFTETFIFGTYIGTKWLKRLKID
jgi:hypothetical protein